MDKSPGCDVGLLSEKLFYFTQCLLLDGIKPKMYEKNTTSCMNTVYIILNVDVCIYFFHKGFEYSRSGNPTRNCLEKAVAALDGAKYCE